MAFCSGESRPPEIRFISTHKVHCGIKRSGMPRTTPSAFRRLATVIARFSPFGMAKIRTCGYLTRNQLMNPTCSSCSEGDVFEAEISVTAETLRLRLMFFLHLGIIELHDLLIARVMVGWLHLDLAGLRPEVAFV